MVFNGIHLPNLADCVKSSYISCGLLCSSIYVIDEIFLPKGCLTGKIRLCRQTNLLAWIAELVKHWPSLSKNLSSISVPDIFFFS